MQYHVAQNGEKTGPFDRDEVYRRLVAGELQGTDLGWHEGLGEWEPLAKLFPPQTASSASPPPVFAASAAAGNVPTHPQKTSGTAIASMICGILGLLFWLPCIPAIILGHLSLSAIKKSAGALTGRGLAIAGLVTGYLMLALIPVILLISFGAVSVLHTQIDSAKNTRVRSDIMAISLALQSYESRALRFPTTEQGLHALVRPPKLEPVPASWRAIMEDTPKDPWGQDYQYRFPAQKSPKPYDIYSVGPDGQPDTEDDIGNWQ